MQLMLLGERIKATAFTVVIFKFRGVNGSKEGGREAAKSSG